MPISRAGNPFGSRPRAAVPTHDWFEQAGRIRVCNFNEPNSYTASATGGTVLASSFTLGFEACAVICRAPLSAPRRAC